LHVRVVDGYQSEAVAALQCELDRSGRDPLRDVEACRAWLRLVGLRHRGSGVQHDPQCQRTLSFGLAHEVPVGTREQFPVDLAQVIAGLIAPVLRELQAAAALLAGVQAMAVRGRAEACLQPQWPQAREHLGWKCDQARFLRAREAGAGPARSRHRY
jgi:hypothetical protein